VRRSQRHFSVHIFDDKFCCLRVFIPILMWSICGRISVDATKNTPLATGCICRSLAVGGPCSASSESRLTGYRPCRRRPGVWFGRWQCEDDACRRWSHRPYTESMRSGYAWSSGGLISRILCFYNLVIIAKSGMRASLDDRNLTRDRHVCIDRPLAFYDGAL
jgi:hypothetical protein